MAYNLPGSEHGAYNNYVAELVCQATEYPFALLMSGVPCPRRAFRSWNDTRFFLILGVRNMFFVEQPSCRTIRWMAFETVSRIPGRILGA